MLTQLHGASRIFTELNGAMRRPGNCGIRQVLSQRLLSFIFARGIRFSCQQLFYDFIRAFHQQIIRKTVRRLPAHVQVSREGPPPPREKRKKHVSCELAVVAFLNSQKHAFVVRSRLCRFSPWPARWSDCHRSMAHGNIV